MPEKQHQPDTWPPRDEVSDEDGPHRNQDVSRESAKDSGASRRERRSQDVDPDSAESMVDRDDSIGEG